MKLGEHTKMAILELQKKYPDKRSALLPALHLAQNEVGYLPPEIQEEMAILFDLTSSEIHSVVSFYDMFFEKPVGKHVIHVCKNLSCMLRGSDELLSALSSKLKVSQGEVTEDGEFTFVPCECLAACDRAPVIQVDTEIVGPVQLNEIEGILEAAKLKNRSSPIGCEEEENA